MKGSRRLSFPSRDAGWKYACEQGHQDTLGRGSVALKHHNAHGAQGGRNAGGCEDSTISRVNPGSRTGPPSSYGRPASPTLHMGGRIFTVPKGAPYQ